MAWLNWSLKLHIWLKTISLLISHTSHMFMLNECHFHLCECTCLNVFSHAQSLLIKHKNIFECFSFWKVFFFFCKNCQNLQKLCSPVLATQSWVGSVTCPSREKYLEYFSKFGSLFFLRLKEVTCSWVQVLVARGT